MTRHRFDPLSFTFGLTFLALTALAISDRIDLAAPGLRWLAAGFLLLLGVLMIVTSANRDRA